MNLKMTRRSLFLSWVNSFPSVNGRLSSSSSRSSKHFVTDALQHTPSCVSHVAFSAPCFCLRGVSVGGCEGLFLCLFFIWAYRCVPLCCPSRCPKVSTFLIKWISVPALCSVCGMLLNVSLKTFYSNFKKKSVLTFVFFFFFFSLHQPKRENFKIWPSYKVSRYLKMTFVLL